MALAAQGVGFTLHQDLPFPEDADVVAVLPGVTDPVAATKVTDDGAWTGEWAVDVPAAVCATAGIKAVTWQADEGVASSTIDVRAGNPFPMAELRRQMARGATVATEAAMRAAVEHALIEFEDACRCRMVPQVVEVPVEGVRGREWVPPFPMVRRVVEGPEGVTATVRAGVVVFDRAPADDWTVVVEHGEPELAADVERAVAVLALSYLADGAFDDRGMVVSDQYQAVRLLTAGVGGAAFSIPVVQTAYRRHRHTVVG